MNPIDGNFNIANDSKLLNKAKTKAEEVDRFKKVLDNKMEGTLGKTKSPVNKKLMGVCQEFESILVNQMFKSMRRTLNKENSLLNGGQAEEIFEDMLYDKYSLLSVKTAKFGLAEQIYDQLNDTTTLPNQ